MKRLLFVIFSTILTNPFAAGTDSPNGAHNMAEMDNMMYMNFGLGIAYASDWPGSSLAINAMTMGFYYKPSLGVEIGMDMLPNGTYQDSTAMINTFHVAAKGILSLSSMFNLYGKLGLGVNAGQAMPQMQMITPVNVGPYYGMGLQLNLFKQFAIYIEDTGVVAIGGANSGGFGSTNIATAGIEIRM